MKRAYSNHIACLLCALFLLMGCEKQEPYRVKRNDTLYLSLSTALPDVTDEPVAKAGETRYLASEKIRSLRIVLVSKANDNDLWTVEANELYTLENTGGMMPSDLTYAISHTRHKRIYLFGNCEDMALLDGSGKAVDLKTDYSVFIPDASGVAPVDGFRFECRRGSGNATASRDDYVPMSAVYNVELPADINEIPVVGNFSHVYTLPRPLYLIRAVTKFTASYWNKTAERAPVHIQVRGWSVSKIASGTSYLLAAVQPDWARTTKPADGETEWQYWLAAEAAKTQKNDYRPYEWMYAYDLPDDAAQHETYACDYPYEGNSNYNIYHDDPATALTKLPPVYLPESKNLAEGESAYGKQAYEVVLKTWEWEKEKDYGKGREMTYTVTLPECQSLFRNTDVRLNVTFLGDAVSLQVVVCPWEKQEKPIDIPAFESVSL